MSHSFQAVDLFDEKEQLSVPNNNISNTVGDERNRQFDEIIGVLEDVLVGQTNRHTHTHTNTYCNRPCHSTYNKQRCALIPLHSDL